MSVRNCVEIGENLQLIVNRLLANDDLVKLLYYSDKDPLSQPALTEAEKKEKIFNKLIRIVPQIEGQEDARSSIVIRVLSGNSLHSNSEFKDVTISVTVFVPITQWIIKNTNLRPFLILGEIEKSIRDKTVNGLGKMVGGDFELALITEQMTAYDQIYTITSYD